jgi:hypothetical protein
MIAQESIDIIALVKLAQITICNSNCIAPFSAPLVSSTECSFVEPPSIASAADPVSFGLKKRFEKGNYRCFRHQATFSLNANKLKLNSSNQQRTKPVL